MAYQPADGAASSALDEIVHGPAAALTAVTLLAGPRARATGWAAAAAASIAAGWPGPRRVVLVDLDLERPSLHDHAGGRNEEGIADVVDYGVSLALVRQPGAGAGYDVVPAGLYVADAGAVLRSDAWTRILGEAAAQRVTILAFLPADADGADAIIGRTGAVIVLAAEDEADSVVSGLPDPYAVLTVLSPGTAATQEEPATPDSGDQGEDEPLVIAAAASELLDGERAADAEPAAPPPSRRGPAEVAGPPAGGARLSDEEFERIRLPTDRPARESLIADLRDRQRAARLAPVADESFAPQSADTAAGAAAGERGSLLLPTTGGDRAREVRVETMGDAVSLDTLDPGDPRAEVRRSYRRPLLWTLFVVLVVSLLGGAWRYLAGRLGGERTTAEAPVEPPAPVPVPVPVPVDAEPVADEQPLPYVVAIEAHTDLATAFRRVDALNQQPSLAFHIAPLEREGTLYYHVMAGPAGDSAAAVALRDTLLARRLKTAATPTDVRNAPLSFVIGDYSDREAAGEAMSELRRLDVPSYMHLAEAADGAPLYRVFVGAFSAPAEADVTRQLLRAAGVRDSLVTRMGSTSR